MKNWGKVETGVILTISTYHMPKDALETLNDYYSERRIDLDMDHWAKALNWASDEYGYAITASSLREHAKNGTDKQTFLLEAAELARDFGAQWIMFDRDAQTVEGMTEYENTY